MFPKGIKHLFGYKSKRKVEKLNNLAMFWWLVGTYCLNMIISQKQFLEIWWLSIVQIWYLVTLDFLVTTLQKVSTPKRKKKKEKRKKDCKCLHNTNYSIIVPARSCSRYSTPKSLHNTNYSIILAARSCSRYSTPKSKEKSEKDEQDGGTEKKQTPANQDQQEKQQPVINS